MLESRASVYTTLTLVIQRMEEVVVVLYFVKAGSKLNTGQKGDKVKKVVGRKRFLLYSLALFEIIC